MSDDSIRALVLDELKRLRKRSGAVTVDALSLAPTLCELLGAGDPFLAYTRLSHHLLDGSDERSITAAAASLGFSSDGDTHLHRLTEAGQQLSVDQRQARRLSDEGLEALARLIATNWTIEAVPEFTAILIAERDGVTVAFHAHHPAVAVMREPVVEVLSGDERIVRPLSWSVSEDGARIRLRCGMPLGLAYDERETSLAVQWRGELWPKFTVRLVGGASPDSVETLGNRLMLRLWAAT